MGNFYQQLTLRAEILKLKLKTLITQEDKARIQKLQQQLNG